MSQARHHAEWLRLIDVSGAFLSIPVLLDAFPHGLDAHDPDILKSSRNAFDEWEPSRDPAIHTAWIRFVLTDVLGYPAECVREGYAYAETCRHVEPQCGETTIPDLAICHPDRMHKPEILVMVVRPGQRVDSPMPDRRWSASPQTRMQLLLASSERPLGLVTNGEQWSLVYSRPGELTTYATWHAHLWLEDHITLQAFRSLLGPMRVFGAEADKTLRALLERSAQDQQEVTDRLGFQVRRAVEVLVATFDRLDRDSDRRLLNGLTAEEVYNAALTVMMRLVFLFAAEERGLLRLGEDLYDSGYAVSTLSDHLIEAAEKQGEEVLEYRSDAWCRLLATFRIMHSGVQHEDMRLPAYGGSLFDPNRYPFLEGRSSGDDAQATPPRVDNRTVLHLLDSLQYLTDRLPGGGPAEKRRLSFRALDVEQIGHVYEGLLDHTAMRATEPVVSLVGKEGEEPEVPVSALERERARGGEALLTYLHKESGKSPSSLTKLLQRAPEKEALGRLRAACEGDEGLCERLLPFASLIREDPCGRPVVLPTGSYYVTKGEERRATGTHYTPRSLTEEVVRYALEPLVYEGPAEGRPPDEWRLRSAKEIVDLKVCDMAMGSGAFLVQACRYLSERLIEAWDHAQEQADGKLGFSPEGHYFTHGARDPGTRITTPYGNVTVADPSEQLLPDDPDEKLALARRIIADRCLYGVDKNPMAVEMAKLSLWLVTMQKERPFTFLDHALRSGDSLLGVSVRQLEVYNMDPKGQSRAMELPWVGEAVKAVTQFREQIERIPSHDPETVSRKSDIFRRIKERAGPLTAAADALIADALAGRAAPSPAAALRGEHSAARMGTPPELRERSTFHWELEFSDVFLRENGGFDAILTNPPFLGGQKITGALRTDYREFLVKHLAGGARGSADLCSYFFLRACGLIRRGGMFAMLATNTIAQGDTREVGLDQIVKSGVSIPRATASRKWPGDANLEIAEVWMYRGDWSGERVLDGRPVAGITPFLTPPGRVAGTPFRLDANAGKSFQGSIVLGMGFVLTPEEAQALIAKDRRNADVLQPYLNGEDLNSRPDQSPSRCVINFRDWPLSRDAAGGWTVASEADRRDWLRAGGVPRDYPGPVAADYPDCLAVVELKVKPDRARLAGGDATGRDRARRWWQFARPTTALYAAIAGMERVFVHPLTSKFNNLVQYPLGIVYSHMTVVLALRSWTEYSVLQSGLHWEWVLRYGNKLETRPQYTPSDCVETFPFPSTTSALADIGQRYYDHRQGIMLARQQGLTTTYNRFHDPKERAEDIVRLRELHIEMDRAVAAAYGWTDLDLGHGFHETKQGLRITFSPSARQEVLDRLLALNHERHAAELAAGLHGKRGKKRKKEELGEDWQLVPEAHQGGLF